MIRWRPDALARSGGATVTRLAKSPLFKVIVGVAGIVAALIAAFGSPFNPTTSSGQPSASVPGPSGATTTPPAPSSDPVTPRLAVGSCFDGTRAAVPCTSAHRYEVVAVDGKACSAEAAIRHLGGHPGREVLLVPPVRVVLANTTVCAITTPGAETSYVPAKGALGGGSSAPWRRCLDERVANDAVACSVPHTGEFVGTDGVPAPDAARCRTAAEAYMGVTIDRVSDRLAVAVIPTQRVDDGRPRCLVRALGNALLIDTLRNIGDRSLPLVAGD